MADAQREAILASPGFGRFFSDHMVTIEWTEGRGWHDAQLVPYGPLELDPATPGDERPAVSAFGTSAGDA